MALYLFRLEFPSVQVWDEQYHVPAAQSYLRGPKTNYLNLNNPPLGKEFIALAISFGGDNPWASRLSSALTAAALGALLFFASLYWTGRWESGLISTLLWVTSPLAYLHGRLAMLDMPTALFYTGGLAAFLPVLKAPGAPGRHRWIALACLIAAFGTSIKVIVAALFPLYLLGLILIRARLPLGRSLPALFAAATAFICLAWISTYGVLGFSPDEIPGQIARMIRIQTTPHQDYAGLSSWPDWFLGRGSLWFHSQKTPSGGRFAALCTNNPLLWIPGALAMIGLWWKGWRGSAPAVYLGLAVPLQILFWLALKSQWILSYGLPMEPVFCLAIPVFLNSIFKKKTSGRHFAALWGLCLAGAAGVYFLKVLPSVFGFFQS